MVQEKNLKFGEEIEEMHRLGKYEGEARPLKKSANLKQQYKIYCLKL